MPGSLADDESLYGSQGDTSGRHCPKKLFVEGHGDWLVDAEGRRYLDLQMCNSAANFGYGSPPHVEAMVAQIHTLPSLASEFLSPQRVELARGICLATEQRFGVKGRVHFSVGGAQAIEDMLKLVTRTTGSSRVFAFEGSYHGRTLAASCISGAYRYRAAFAGTALADFVPFPYCNRCPYDDRPETCEYRCIAQFARLFEGEGAGQDDGNGRSECRAFVAEPVLGRGGYLPAPPEYFRRLRAVLDRHRVLLVADEIHMGFFRAGKLWSMENYGVCPDIIVFGKALTNGMFPLSGLWAREPLMAPANWPPGSAHASFAGAPLGVTLGLATIKTFASVDWRARAEEVGNAVEEICRALSASYPQIWRINRIGAALSLDIAELDGTPAGRLARNIVETALEGEIKIDGEPLGLVMSVGGSFGNMVTIAPSLNIHPSSLAIIARLLRAVFERVGMTPGASKVIDAC